MSNIVIRGYLPVVDFGDFANSWSEFGGPESDAPGLGDLPNNQRWHIHIFQPDVPPPQDQPFPLKEPESFDQTMERMRRQSNHSNTPASPDQEPKTTKMTTITQSISFLIRDWWGETFHTELKFDPVDLKDKAVTLFIKMSQTTMGKVGLVALFLLTPLSHIIFFFAFIFAATQTNMDKKTLVALFVAWIFSPLVFIGGLSYVAYQAYKKCVTKVQNFIHT